MVRYTLHTQSLKQKPNPITYTYMIGPLLYKVEIQLLGRLEISKNQLRILQLRGLGTGHTEGPSKLN